MDKQLGMAEFFAMEAGEYLERLDALVSAPGMPSGEEFQRLTRALRGAALMANQQVIAGTAGAFEQVARAVREGRRSWDEATRQLAIRAVDDLKRLVRRVRDWDASDTARARALAGELEQVGGRTTPGPRLSSPDAADAGTRAFLAREGAALAAALARAAGALERNPAQREAAQPVLQVMQPLRGLASLRQFPPLPDLLDGIDRAATLLARAPQPMPNGAAVLDAAAKALTQATRDITTGGQADAESVEVRRFAEALRSLLGLEPPETDIEALYFDDAGPHIVEGAERRVAGVRLGTVELTALGEHFRQIGAAVEDATTDTQRELRAVAATDALRSLERGAAEDWRATALAFAQATRAAIARGAAVREATQFASLLRDAGQALATGASRSLEGIARQLMTLAGPISAAPTAAPPSVPPVAPPNVPSTVPLSVPPAAPPGGGPAAPTPVPPWAAVTPEPAAPVDGSEPGALPETDDLAGSLLRYERYVETLGLGPASLAALLAGPPRDPRLAPPPAAAASAGPAPPLTPVIEAPAPEAAEPEPAAEALVPIADLCYSGPAALQRAMSLRHQVRDLLAAGTPSVALADLVEEIFDLVQLGLDTP